MPLSDSEAAELAQYQHGSQGGSGLSPAEQAELNGYKEQGAQGSVGDSSLLDKLGSGLETVNSFRSGVGSKFFGGLLTPHAGQQQAMQDSPVAAGMGKAGGFLAQLGAGYGAAKSLLGLGSAAETPEAIGPLAKGPFPNFPPSPSTPLFEAASPEATSMLPSAAESTPQASLANAANSASSLAKALGPDVAKYGVTAALIKKAFFDGNK